MFHSFDLFRAYTGLTAGYTDRHGGCSQGSYATFNCNLYCGDNEQAVLANRRQLEQTFGMPLITAHQQHGTEILSIGPEFYQTGPEERQTLLEGKDAIVTAETGILIGIHTADCIPLLLYDPQERVCAAIHAGWRGTAADITGHTLNLLIHHYHCHPGHLAAAIGPGISLAAFEVGDEVYEAFRCQGFDMRRIARRFQPSGKWHMDLKAANHDRLIQYGIPEKQIEDVGICTWQDTDYFSARRMGVRSGRILTYIGMKEPATNRQSIP